jgi:uncharacterized protein YcbX
MEERLIKHLIIYPIKSLGPIFVDEIVIGPHGLNGDREMMLIDSQGKFISQRTKNELVRFQLKKYQDTYKIIDRWGNSEIIIQIDGFIDYVKTVTIWEDQVNQVMMNPEVSDWFSKILNENVRLVKLNKNFNRPLPEKYQTSFSHSTSFADSLPILVCTTASFQFVENDYGNFDFIRFRPNIVIKNLGAFEEDEWKDVRLGSVEFSVKKKCARCNLITVDPQSGEIDKSFLTKLSAYRNADHKVFFGVHMVPLSGGKVEIGDSFEHVSIHEII